MRNIVYETKIVEQFVVEILKNKFQKIEHISLKNPSAEIDIVANGLKIDVKFAYPTMISRQKRLPVWAFDLRKGYKKNKFHKQLDFFVCVGFKYNQAKQIFMIPFSEAPKSQLRISVFGKSKWHQYSIWSKE